ncbi:hypothetical protein [uncultured Arcobacter sp.]|uniref:hypothetical protein n=1 Tax=uncultured Arcobacter sp. TaxID=165434 RepID=UPI002618B9ED|nr:hypothetical protein [uncultured Arcobacter sp.]
MSRATSIQNKLAAKVFNGLGSTGVLSTISTSVKDKWGDGTITYSTGTSIKIVPYNMIDERQNFQPFGDLNENEMDAVVPYGTSVNVNDKITLRSVDYKVIEKGAYTLLDEELAWVLRLAKIL